VRCACAEGRALSPRSAVAFVQAAGQKVTLNFCIDNTAFFDCKFLSFTPRR